MEEYKNIKLYLIEAASFSKKVLTKFAKYGLIEGKNELVELSLNDLCHLIRNSEALITLNYNAEKDAFGVAHPYDY